MSEVSKKRGRVDLSCYKGELWALLAALGYALSSLFARVAVRDYPLNFMMGASVRALPTFLFALYMVWRLSNRPEKTVSPFSDWRLVAMLVGYGLLTFLLGNPLLLRALQLGGVLIATPVAGTQSLWATLLAAVFLGQVLNGRMIGGILVSISGILLLTLGQNPGSAVSSQWLLAVPFALVTALSWASSGVLMTGTLRRGVNRFHSLAIATGSGILALNIYLPITGQIGAYAETPLAIHGAMLVAGLLNAVALVSITSALVHTSIATATTLNSLQIALGPLLAWVFLGEQLGVVTGLGALLVAGGAIFVQQAAARARGGANGKAGKCQSQLEGVAG